MKYQNPALAQLEEHLTVEVTWKSRGPWFKSGKPDFFFKKRNNYYFFIFIIKIDQERQIKNFYISINNFIIFNYF